MNRTILVAAVAALAALCGCKATKQNSEAGAAAATGREMETVQTQHMPHAVIYKTNGDYNANVAVTLSADGKTLASYPAPGDVNANFSAQPLDNGWLLARSGAIGERTAFLTYTYEQYSKLKKTPTQAQLLAAIIPGAKVETVRVLPLLHSQALENPNLLKQYTE